MTIQNHDDDDRFTELATRYLDGSLNESDTLLLNETLRAKPGKRELFVDFCIQSQLIRELGDACLEDASQPNVVPHPDQPEVQTSSRRRLLAGAAVLVAIAATIVFAVIFVPQPSPVLASLSHVQGEVFVGSENGKRDLAATARPIRVGDTIAVEAPDSFAVVKFIDGTELGLNGNSRMLIKSDRELQLAEGTLLASVVRQKTDEPLVLFTSHATVHVLGTVFSVAAAPDRTDVSVDEGRVRVTRAADGNNVEVGKGEFAVTGDQRHLIVRDIPQPPNQWSIDFEAGLPASWKQGVPETEGLPTDSLGAARAELVQNDQGDFYQICSTKKWRDGLFAIHDDSHLSFTFKLERPEWFQIFISTRPFDPDLPPTFLYRFRDDRLWKWGNRGRWLRVKIPLSEFERVPEREGTPPLGEVPFEVLFSSQGEDRGLVIDQLSVSRGGPAEIVIEELKPLVASRSAKDR